MSVSENILVCSLLLFGHGILAQTEETKVLNFKPVTYPDGELALLKFLFKNIKVPQGCSAPVGCNNVVICIDVDANGTSTGFTIIKSLGYDIDKAVVEVFKMIDKWEPAIENGQAVVSSISFPIRLKLE